MAPVLCAGWGAGGGPPAGGGLSLQQPALSGLHDSAQYQQGHHLPVARLQDAATHAQCRKHGCAKDQGAVSVCTVQYSCHKKNQAVSRCVTKHSNELACFCQMSAGGRAPQQQQGDHPWVRRGSWASRLLGGSGKKRQEGLRLYATRCSLYPRTLRFSLSYGVTTQQQLAEIWFTKAEWIMSWHYILTR